MQLCGLLDNYVDTEEWEPDDKDRIAQAWKILDRNGISPAMVQQSIQPADAMDQSLTAKPHPGPWKLEGNEIRCEPDDFDGGRVICEMISSRSIGETTSNGLLIQSAPDMRAILQEIVSSHSDIPRLGLSLVSLDLVEKAQDLLCTMTRLPIGQEDRPSEMSEHSSRDIPSPSD
jgi:hypothetical protein